MRKNWYVLIGLVIFNLVFVLGIAISIYALLASLWIIMGSFLLSPFVLVSLNFLDIKHFSFMNSFISFGLFVIGTVLIPICRKVTSSLVKVSEEYVDFNKKLIYKY